MWTCSRPRTPRAGRTAGERIPGVEAPEELTSVARLHRSAGLLEHELLLRLAELRSSRGAPPAA